jgi:hypothetical protein
LNALQRNQPKTEGLKGDAAMNAIAGAPYPTAPFSYFLFTELSVYALLIGCIIHA